MKHSRLLVIVSTVLALTSVWTASAVAVAQPSSQESDSERESLVAVLSAYHAALHAGEAAKVADVLGPSLFMADSRSVDGADRLSAHLFLSGADLRAWPRAFLDEAGPYRNEFHVISVDVRGDSAVVLTRDTGSNGFRSWRDEEVAWLLGRAAGQWRIVGMIVRDIQLPER